ncbi:conserved hypothetical protein [Agrobacterium fabacearum CFBP 5771]|jgi:hypothetical protein|nr:conserved hypothetical protein [Agrobacterium fabacearum CFBP 5771]
MPAFTEIARDIGGDRFNAGDPRGLRRGHAGGATRPYLLIWSLFQIRAVHGPTAAAH